MVDDGSTDDPVAVVSRFPGVRLIRQPNRGRSAARNAGVWSTTCNHLLFLDADDRLLPNALEAGMARAAMNSKCGFVYGGHRDIMSASALVRQKSRTFHIDGTAQVLPIIRAFKPRFSSQTGWYRYYAKPSSSTRA